MKNSRITKKGFPFEFDPSACGTCKGRCCNGTEGSVAVGRDEIKEISAFLDLPAERFIGEFLRKVRFKYSLREIQTNENYSCIFFGKDGCTIYPVRPRQCRTFPFWEEFRKAPEDAADECPGVFLFSS